MDQPTVIVIGGGLAGIAAAVRLADAGLPVTLLESRQRLGGRATSFTDPATGRTLDNCQHVLLGCCTNLIALYERLDVSGLIQWHRRLYFTDATGAIDVMEADDLPAPLHMTRCLWAFRTLSYRQKLAISRGMVALMRADRAELERVSFQRWLEDHGQPPQAIARFWSVIVVGAVNELPQRMAAAHAAQVFQEGFLGHSDAYVMGVSSVPLVRLYDAAERVIQGAGGRVMLAASAEQLEFDGRRITGVRLLRGQRLTADAFVSAVPHDRLEKLCPPELVRFDARLRNLDKLGFSPIVGIHLWFRSPAERQVMHLPHLVLMDSPLQWVFHKGRDEEVGGEHLHGVVSAAHDLVDQPAEAIIEMAAREVHKALPASRGAPLVHAKVVKEKRATFSAAPGSEAFRPTARGAVANLYLAGDWCRTGWPATMEGAVRSGILAAGAVREDTGGPAASLTPDLEPEPLYRWLAGRRH